MITDHPTSTRLLPGDAGSWLDAQPLTSPADAPGAAERYAERFLAGLGFVLVGYATLGRGFAYLGVAPLFVGEAALGAGLLVLLATGGWWKLFDLAPAWLLVPLAGWGLARTLPYLREYKVDALRDAVLWGYAAWAIVVGGLLVVRPARLEALIERYRVRFVPLFLVIIPVTWVLQQAGFLSGLRWPVTGSRVFDIKAGDVLVHLGGITAFMIVGLAGAPGRLLNVVLPMNVLLLGVTNRGGLVSFLVAAVVAGAMRPSRWMARMAAGVVILLAALAVSGINIRLPGSDREISFDQLAANIGSVVGLGASEVSLDNTKEWRLDWWGDIAGYTLGGRYFWTGKGFGVNLADDDGYQVRKDGSLRSPHNGHLTMLARAGVPGLVLWIAVQGSWAAAVLGAARRAKRVGERHWESVFIFLLAYGAAFMCNATFDVFIEGPMGGVWFWTVFGAGLAAVWTFRRGTEAAHPQRVVGG